MKAQEGNMHAFSIQCSMNSCTSRSYSRWGHTHLYCWWRCEQSMSIQHCTCEHALGRCFMTPHFRPPHLTLSRLHLHGSVSHSWCLSVVDFKTHHVQRKITWIWHPGSCSQTMSEYVHAIAHTNRITTLLNMHSIAQRLYDIMTSTTQVQG